MLDPHACGVDPAGMAAALPLMEFLASLPNMALGWRAAGPRRDPNTAAMEADRNEILDGTSLAL